MHDMSSKLLCYKWHTHTCHFREDKKLFAFGSKSIKLYTEYYYFVKILKIYMQHYITNKDKVRVHAEN
jgi:hypothetical protein